MLFLYLMMHYSIGLNIFLYFPELLFALFNNGMNLSFAALPQTLPKRQGRIVDRLALGAYILMSISVELAHTNVNVVNVRFGSVAE